jgi:hypothetical protein
MTGASHGVTPPLRVAPCRRGGGTVAGFGFDGIASLAGMPPSRETQLHNLIFASAATAACALIAPPRARGGQTTRLERARSFDGWPRSRRRPSPSPCSRPGPSRLWITPYLTDLLEVSSERLHDRPSLISPRSRPESPARSISGSCARLAGEDASTLLRVNGSEHGSAVARGSGGGETGFEAGQTVKRGGGELGPSAQGTASARRSGAKSPDEPDGEFAINLWRDPNTLIKRTGAEASSRGALGRSRAGSA